MSGSDERDDDGPDQGRSEPDAVPAQPPAPSKARTADEDALELDDLDKVGVDGLVAQLRGRDDGPPLEPPPRRIRRGRSPVLSVVVAAFGIYLLVTMFPDFRYWLQSNEPQQLGSAAELVKQGKMPDGLHDHYIEITGTPDVQHAARMTTPKGYVGYLRITEGGGSLFAAIARGKDEVVRDKFEGRFVGRMKQLGRDPATTWLEQYLHDENVVRTIDAEPAALWEALRRQGDAVEIASHEGRTPVAQGERVRVVVHPPDARVQLGVASFRDPEAAEAKVAALGYPYLALGSSRNFHSFVARIPEAEREAVSAKLGEGLDVDAENTDPKRGAIVLPGTVAFSAAFGDYQLAGDDISLPREGEGGPTLYDVKDGKLIARSDDHGRLAIPTAWVHAVRIEEPIRVDRSGYLVVVGETPREQRLSALLWLVVAALVAINVAGLVQFVRRRVVA